MVLNFFLKHDLKFIYLYIAIFTRQTGRVSDQNPTEFTPAGINDYFKTEGSMITSFFSLRLDI